jgi:hypothetical protein
VDPSTSSIPKFFDRKPTSTFLPTLAFIGTELIPAGRAKGSRPIELGLRSSF